MNKGLKSIKGFFRRMKKGMLQKKAYDYPAVAVGWVKYENNPVLGDNEKVFFDPCVRFFDGELWMCVSNRFDNCIEFYNSLEGIVWKKCEKLTFTGSSSGWDCFVNRASFVINENDIYLWYTGQCEGRSAIGYAVSKNRCQFEKCAEKPILEATQAFEKVAVMNPCVMWDSNSSIFRMWYAAGDNYEPDVIGYAESKDGIEWVKHSSPIMKADPSVKYKCSKIGACDVISKDGKLMMAYIAYQNIHVARICFAYSLDGFNWKDDDENPIICPEKGRWDAHSVYKPTIYYDEKLKKLLLWYNGRTDKQECIGFAYK